MKYRKNFYFYALLQNRIAVTSAMNILYLAVGLAVLSPLQAFEGYDSESKSVSSIYAEVKDTLRMMLTVQILICVICLHAYFFLLSGNLRHLLVAVSWMTNPGNVCNNMANYVYFDHISALCACWDPNTIKKPRIAFKLLHKKPPVSKSLFKLFQDDREYPNIQMSNSNKQQTGR